GQGSNTRIPMAIATDRCLNANGGTMGKGVPALQVTGACIPGSRDFEARHGRVPWPPLDTERCGPCGWFMGSHLRFHIGAERRCGKRGKVHCST
ncbi:MAG TPA: hypothetical protein DCZ69_09300, partial [Syntrophobacteraceae bacterium]|nr:hypothetical protein [Syntrophobacteraceae bacterium]